MTDADPNNPYVLGHSSRELERLSTQARLIDPITRRFFGQAGIGLGMRVLDVGSGAGDVAFLASDLVGGTGEVVGLDRSRAALEVARERATERSLSNVTFLEGDAATIALDPPFDAAVGRYVLQFQDDPATMLRTVAALVRRGGMVVFHELDWGGVRSAPPVATYDWCCQLIVETLRASATETRMGEKLFSAFIAAGLPAPSMRLEAVVGGGTNSSDPLELIADLVGSLSTTIAQLGLASVAELDAETLLGRMRNEAQLSNSVVVGHFQFGAWSRVA